MAMTVMFTTQQLMTATGLGADRLAELEKDRVIERSARNRWPAVETLGALVRHYRDEARRGHRSAADAELRRARAREIELRTAERMHKLIGTDEALGVVSDSMGIVLATLSGLPARASRDLTVRRAIEDAVYDLRMVLSRRFEEQAESLRGTGKAVAAPPSYRASSGGDADATA